MKAFTVLVTILSSAAVATVTAQDGSVAEDTMGSMGSMGSMGDGSIDSMDSMGSMSSMGSQESAGNGDPCKEVSVVGDATFCIQGPVCSGTPDQPGGTNCPKIGDVAVSECWDYVPSYGDNNCVAPVNAMCEVIDTGVWGCVWNTGGSQEASGAGSRNSTNGNSTDPEDPDTIQFPSRVTTLSASSDGSSASTTGVFVVVVAAVAAVAAVVAAGMFYRRKQATRQSEVMEFEDAVDRTPFGGAAAITPPPQDSRHAYTSVNI